MSVGDKGLPKFPLARCAQCTLTAQGWALLDPGSWCLCLWCLGGSPLHFWGLQVYVWLVAVVFSGSVGPRLQYWK